MRAIRITLCVLALVMSEASHAGIQVTGRITQLWVNDSSRSNVIWVLVSGAFTSGCTSPNYIVFDLTQPGMKETYAMALSAFHTSANVTIGTDGCLAGHEQLKFMYLTG